MSEKVATKLNSLIDNKDFMIYHLKENKKGERVNQFKVISGEWNYLFFHKKLEDKMKTHTSLFNNIAAN